MLQRMPRASAHLAMQPEQLLQIWQQAARRLIWHQHKLHSWLQALLSAGCRAMARLVQVKMSSSRHTSMMGPQAVSSRAAHLPKAGSPSGLGTQTQSSTQELEHSLESPQDRSPRPHCPPHSMQAMAQPQLKMVALHQQSACTSLPALRQLETGALD